MSLTPPFREAPFSKHEFLAKVFPLAENFSHTDIFTPLPLHLGRGVGHETLYTIFRFSLQKIPTFNTREASSAKVFGHETHLISKHQHICRNPPAESQKVSFHTNLRGHLRSYRKNVTPSRKLCAPSVHPLRNARNANS